jgi:hypothetical protein
MNTRPGTLAVRVLAMLLAGCNATPLPIPPEMDERGISLIDDPDQTGYVLFMATDDTSDPAVTYSIQNVTTAAAPASFVPQPDGSFSVSIEGSLGHSYRFQAFDEGSWHQLFDCTSDGSGGLELLADQDADADGFDITRDCNDTDATIFPGALEICDDLIDNDCDGMVDGADGDCSCTPSAEICDGLDNDCDGVVDEGC